MKLYIKYMVSLRCKMAVKSALNKLGLKHGTVELGRVYIKNITAEQRTQLKALLSKSGLELMDDKKVILVEKIKNIVIEMVHYADGGPQINFSDYLTEKLNYNYTYLASLFSQVTSTTIERYVIAHRIERVKELLLYEEFNLTEISYKLNYSSVAHLSQQFKKVTGVTPTYFKQQELHKKRLTLEEVGMM